MLNCQLLGPVLWYNFSLYIFVLWCHYHKECFLLHWTLQFTLQLGCIYVYGSPHSWRIKEYLTFWCQSASSPCLTADSPQISLSVVFFSKNTNGTHFISTNLSVKIYLSERQGDGWGGRSEQESASSCPVTDSPPKWQLWCFPYIIVPMTNWNIGTYLQVRLTWEHLWGIPTLSDEKLQFGCVAMFHYPPWNDLH